jgi:hypothetical protein
MNGQKSTYFSPLVMLKIYHAFQTIKKCESKHCCKIKTQTSLAV